MSMFSSLWSEYWWILPLGLMLLCMIGCIRGLWYGAACCPCCSRRVSRMEPYSQRRS